MKIQFAIGLPDFVCVCECALLLLLFIILSDMCDAFHAIAITQYTDCQIVTLFFWQIDLVICVHSSHCWICMDFSYFQARNSIDWRLYWIYWSAILKPVCWLDTRRSGSWICIVASTSVARAELHFDRSPPKWIIDWNARCRMCNMK